MFYWWESLTIFNICLFFSFCCSEQFYVRIEGKLPAYNTRVKLPEDQRLDLFIDGELAGTHTHTHTHAHTH